MNQCNVQVPSCIDELRTMLASIFLVQLVIGNLEEFVLPGLRLWWRNDRCGYVKKRRAKRESREAFHVSITRVTSIN